MLIGLIVLGYAGTDEPVPFVTGFFFGAAGLWALVGDGEASGALLTFKSTPFAL